MAVGFVNVDMEVYGGKSYFLKESNGSVGIDIKLIVSFLRETSISLS